MRIMLADGQTQIRSALKLLLEQQGFEVIGEAEDAENLMMKMSLNQPDVLLLDWNLPKGEMDSSDLIRDLKRRKPSLKIIILSSRHGQNQTAMAAGADGFVSKSHPPEKLLKVLEGIGLELSPNTKEPKKEVK